MMSTAMTNESANETDDSAATATANALTNELASEARLGKPAARYDSDDDDDMWTRKPTVQKKAPVTKVNAKKKGKNAISVLKPQPRMIRSPVRGLSPINFSDDEDDEMPLPSTQLWPLSSPEPVTDPVVHETITRSPKRQQSRNRKAGNTDELAESPKKKTKTSPKKEPLASTSRPKAAAPRKPSSSLKPQSSKSALDLSASQRRRTPLQGTSRSPSQSPPKSSRTFSAGFPSTSQTSLWVALPQPENAEQRAHNWSLNGCDDLVWVKVQQSDSSYWWPADIKSKVRSERPLRLELLAPRGDLVPNTVSLDDPSSDNLLSFRSLQRPGHLRFSSATFADCTMRNRPAEADFALALDRALVLEHERDQDASDTEATAQAAEQDESDSGDEELAEASRKQNVDENFALQERDEWDIPANCLARWRKGTWWAARAVARTTDSRGKLLYKVQFCDGAQADLAPSEILRPLQKQFFRVDVGETKASFPKNYAQQLVDLVNQINPALLAIVNDQYAPAKTWNDAFFGTPQGRFDLAKLARFGDLTEQLIDVIRSQLVQWLQTTPQPTGTAQFDAMAETDLEDYVTFVLLPFAVLLIRISEEGFEDDAKEELGQGAAEDKVAFRAVQLAQEHLDLSDLTKWANGVRAAKVSSKA